MYVVKDVDGKVREKLERFGPREQRRVRSNQTVWFVSPIMRTVDMQVLHKHDKVSRVRGKVASARVGGQHSSVLTHKVETGLFTETRVY